jgi:hypothetical protein
VIQVRHRNRNRDSYAVLNTIANTYLSIKYATKCRFLLERTNNNILLYNFP